jgi:hypothetical protein
MKNIILLTIVLSTLLCVTSCDKEYPEEVTYSGENIHGFKLNGEKWVRLTTFLPSSGCTYISNIENVSCNFSSIREDSTHYPSGSFQFMLSAKRDSVVIPGHYDFTALTNSILLNYETPGFLNPTKCYCLFYYEKEKFESSTYSQVIYGELELLRFDTLLVGTFEVQLNNGIDTITITDGKFDYQLTIE